MVILGHPGVILCLFLGAKALYNLPMRVSESVSTTRQTSQLMASQCIFCKAWPPERMTCFLLNLQHLHIFFYFASGIVFTTNLASCQLWRPLFLHKLQYLGLRCFSISISASSSFYQPYPPQTCSF